ncbi:phytase [Luteimonas sp. Y-2-2-4F]|nr:phytase [Luteimonas sp. Y-2-2-4F]MCD9030807.1 phytase [Luteimonas sp. Y-2-2-4F]
MTAPRLLPSLLGLVLLAGCTGPEQVRRTLPVEPPQAAPAATRVEETFVTRPDREEELDSLATWVGEDGITRVLATAKSAHRLVVFDGESGERLREVGGRGRAPGQFERPNGIVTFGDLAFVAERDAPRVQVLRLPDLVPVASFGEDALRSPYGLWLHETAPDELDLYVTDSFMYGADHAQLPPDHELGQRVRRYRIDLAEDGVRAHSRGAFGATEGRGRLRVVESVAGDSAQGRLLIADESRRDGTASTLHEYDLEGAYTGRSLPDGAFAGEAEGVALWDCGFERGYWVAADQVVPLTVFHLFDRVTLAPRGSFSGRVTANTDGIALHAATTPRFPAGALYAVHDDRALAAFDLLDVIRALGLDPACAR